jgi:hypothetical protein
MSTLPVKGIQKFLEDCDRITALISASTDTSDKPRALKAMESLVELVPGVVVLVARLKTEILQIDVATLTESDVALLKLIDVKLKSFLSEVAEFRNILDKFEATGEWS